MNPRRPWVRISIGWTFERASTNTSERSESMEYLAIRSLALRRAYSSLIFR